MQNLHDFSDLSFLQWLLKSYSPPTQIVHTLQGYMFMCLCFFPLVFLTLRHLNGKKKEIEKHCSGLLYTVKLSLGLQGMGSILSYLQQVKVMGEERYVVMLCRIKE